MDYTKPSVEVAIVSVTFGEVADIGADAAKRIPSHSRYRYLQTTTYTLEDGRELGANIFALSKPKLAQRAEALTLAIAKREYFASFRGETYVGTVQKFSLLLR